MTHMVIVHTANEKSFYPCDGIDSAVATIERFRNEENVESCELFELNPISFEFKPYYHVALSTGTSAPSVPAAPAFGAAPEIDAPVLAAVESPNPFDSAAGAPAPMTPSLSDAFAAPAPEPAPAFDSTPIQPPPLGVADEFVAPPSALDATLADVGVPADQPIPPLPDAIPPAPAFGEAIPDPMSSGAVADPFGSSPSDAPTFGSDTGLGFELGGNSPVSEFDPVDDSATVSDIFDSGAELPPPPPPPLETDAEDTPRRGLFGR